VDRRDPHFGFLFGSCTITSFRRTKYPICILQGTGIHCKAGSSARSTRMSSNSVVFTIRQRAFIILDGMKKIIWLLHVATLRPDTGTNSNRGSAGIFKKTSQSSTLLLLQNKERLILNQILNFQATAKNARLLLQVVLLLWLMLVGSELHGCLISYHIN